MATFAPPPGTADIFADEARRWRNLENTAAAVFSRYGYGELRTPVFEYTEVFQKGLGNETEVVQKEMYTFEDRGGRSLTLRPEGTAGVVRAMLENGVMNEGFPQKVYYVIPCFRHEKPQAGRLREFHQFGIEMFGAASPYADAEIILLAKSVLDECGLENIELNINSIGCPECRKKYHAALKEYFSAKKDELCDTCRERLDKNPMRILDCKSPICSEIAKGAPIILDYLCDDCRAHFEKLKEILTANGVEFAVNPKIVRGLDYYTRTVFEFISKDIGAQGTVCGGGRYDGLVSELGGQSTPALGFGMGLERLILTMEQQKKDFLEAKTCDIYFAPMGEAAQAKAAALSAAQRRRLCR